VSPKIENGGFPEPPPGEPVLVVRCSHLACGAETRIRLPGSFPASAVRRVVCAGCATPYETATVEELERKGAGRFRTRRPKPATAQSASASPGWLDRPPGRRWTLIAIPIALAAVFAALVLINRASADERPSADAVITRAH
jgi:hypothetical protein